jgi:hypothetical protein
MGGNCCTTREEKDADGNIIQVDQKERAKKFANE